MSNINSQNYASIAGKQEYCEYPPQHMTEFKYVNSACPFDDFEKNTNKPVGLPTQPLHGGLYNSTSTGKEWHTIPVNPEMSSMMANLASANPPPGAMNQFIGTNRPGNNSVNLNGVYRYQPIPEYPNMYNINLLE
jgi:hypothetical protein